MDDVELEKQAHLRRLAPGVYAWIGDGGDHGPGTVKARDDLVVGRFGGTLFSGCE